MIQIEKSEDASDDSEAHIGKCSGDSSFKKWVESNLSCVDVDHENGDTASPKGSIRSKRAGVDASEASGRDKWNHLRINDINLGGRP